MLGFGDDGQTKSGFAGRFGAVDFADAAARKTANAQRQVDGDGAGGNDFDGFVRALADFHERAVAELAIDGSDREIEGFGVALVFGEVADLLSTATLVILTVGSLTGDIGVSV